MLHPADLEILAAHGTVQLRMSRLYRLAHEAWKQGGLLSYEDLGLLLGVDASAIKDLVRRLRAQGLPTPTRGAIKDIGPEPSHRRGIARMLAPTRRRDG